jgi:probable rRNA maturation factor
MGSRSRPQPKLTLAVQNASASGAVPARSALRTWAQAALERDAAVTLRIVDEAEARRLNREFRDRNYATNVLTFAYEDDEPLSGDVVLCAPVIEGEARNQGKTPQAHYAHLVVHGVLHLQGYAHEHDADAAAMEARETEIVTKLGYPDPYATV